MAAFRSYKGVRTLVILYRDYQYTVEVSLTIDNPLKADVVVSKALKRLLEYVEILIVCKNIPKTSRL